MQFLSNHHHLPHAHPPSKKIQDLKPFLTLSLSLKTHTHLHCHRHRRLQSLHEMGVTPPATIITAVIFLCFLTAVAKLDTYSHYYHTFNISLEEEATSVGVDDNPL
ncbi:hypothetical protein L6452_15207 [Arctium lappa]|uniref:Uncharacterized protein n=1 Tax=Arctium lappa TaxID=4217 RepID=A0ACB9CN47_ARCLA|nr:hypothetical protein L6452_15207 [Arctium lappa]